METLTGTGRLVGLVARRDRVRLALWVGGLVSLIVGSGFALLGAYPDQQAIDAYARVLGQSAATIAFAGPGYGFDDPTIGAILVNETQIFGSLSFALMSIFLFVRNTRGEEDAERTDLVGSNVVGRHAVTAAAAIVVATANVATAALCGLGLVAAGYPTTGSFALVASIASVGLAFTGVAAVASQVVGNARGALGLAGVALAAAFTIRAVGDVGDNGWRWLSPMGWAIGVRAFAGERWYMLVPCLVGGVALVVAAFWLSTQRDLGSGLLPHRLGEPHAPRWMGSPLGLAFRLQRTSAISWICGLATLGFFYGILADEVDAMVEDNPTLAEFLAHLGGGSITDSYFATVIVLQALLVSGFAIAAVLRLRSEEAAGHAEEVLVGPVSRSQWAAGHLTIAALGSAAALGASGLAMGAGYAAASGDAADVARLCAGSLVVLPATLVLGALALALFGWRSAAAVGAWGALAVATVIAMFGELLRLPGWVRAVSPIYHLPAVPAVGAEPIPLLLLSLAAAALTAAGLRSLQRRDLATG